MATEDVAVLVEGERHPFVMEVEVSISAENGCRTARIRSAEPDGRFWMPPGAAVVIQASGEPVLTGYVRDYEPDFTKEKAEYSVSVESKTCDAVECSPHHDTGRVEKKDLVAAANELGKGFAARWKAEGVLQQIPEVVLHPAEPLFSCVERYARSQGAFITDNEHGDHVVFSGTRGRHAGVLMYPGNVIGARAKLSERSRKSETRVRGQGSRGHGKAVFRSEGRATDSGVKRHRPHVVLHEGDADQGRLKARAAYDQQRGVGGSVTASVFLHGWRDEGGRIWSPAFVVALDSPGKLKIQQDMAVSSVRLSWAKEGGTVCALELRDPKTFAKPGSGKSGGKSGSKGGGSKGGTGGGSKGGGSDGSKKVTDAVWDVPSPNANVAVA